MGYSSNNASGFMMEQYPAAEDFSGNRDLDTGFKEPKDERRTHRASDRKVKSGK
jgi:hypothetical protein